MEALDWKDRSSGKWVEKHGRELVCKPMHGVRLRVSKYGDDFRGHLCVFLNVDVKAATVEEAQKQLEREFKKVARELAKRALDRA